VALCEEGVNTALECERIFNAIIRAEDCALKLSPARRNVGIKRHISAEC